LILDAIYVFHSGVLPMTRLALLVVPLALLSATTWADEAKGEKVEYATYTDYFEKNNSGLAGDQSFLVFANKEAMAKVVDLRRPVMGGKKPVPVPGEAFDKKLVFAVISRGDAITTYTVEKVTADGDALYVQYKAMVGPAGTARFASPLILTAEKGKAKKVVFIENGKTVGTAEVK
jgi:hypothetical protein